MKVSKCIKSIALSSVLISGLFAGLQAKEDSAGSKQGSLLQEKSGAFVGVQVGFSMLQDMEQKIWNNPYNRNKYTTNYRTAAYGFLGGYEHWFSDSIGARGYALLSGANFYVMQFGIGADFLWNFMNVAGGNMGLIAGLQAGAMYWLNSWYYWSSSNQSPFGFDLAVNVGLRWSQNEHVIELLGKIPFIKTKTGEYIYSDGDKNEYYAKETFSIVARYIYRF